MCKVFWLPVAMASGAYAGSLLDFSYGVLERERGNGGAAGDFFEKAYHADPTAMPLVRIMAKKRMDKGDRSGALEAYNLAIESRPEDHGIAIEYGDFLGDVGKGDALAEKMREEIYQKVLDALPGDLLPVERLIRVARERSDDDKARGLLEKLDASSEEAIRYYIATTKSLYDSKDKDAAARIGERFEKAMQQHPGWAGIARAASDHFRTTGRMDIAIEVLGKHIEARPSSLDLKIRLGILHLTAGHDDDGVRILREVLEVHPRKALAHESLAKHFRKAGMHREARSHAAELLGIRGGTADEFLTLAEELTADSEFRAARLVLEKAVFLHENDAKLMMQLALSTSKDPETKDGAARLYREAEAMLANPAEMEPAFLLESAKELIAQGQTKAAEERLRNAIRSFPKEAKKESAAAMRSLAGIWISEQRNVDAADALISRAKAMEK
jgi:tetratricopeptide (TPR) repeat protein